MITTLSPFHRAVALPLAAAMLVAALPTAPARAGLVATETVIDAAAAAVDRDRVMAFLERDEVRRQMSALGVAPEEAAARVAGLSDAEIARIAGQLSDMPAGGDGLGTIVGAAVLIFVVLLITDIAGLTKVFPFTRSVR